ncbi:ACP S-malonyltransferase [Methylobacterium sp. Leaf87]|uniref:ACP S-malonyltransferase n=1 Tax=Methylobacterium sp. Leaf87 TaxID=1736243 RepID=UPI000B07A740|nr:ACP S-malonyltransferase [Methylobacterium sp. Leaf87]
MTVVFMFPGQSSKCPALLSKFEKMGGDCRHILDEASEVLHDDIRRRFNPESATLFQSNRDVQTGIFVANHIHARMLNVHGVHAKASLGLSLGEYNHLVEIGALSFGDALRLVANRGEAYDCGPAGLMAAVGPLSLEDLSVVIAKAQQAGLVEISNQNSPSQHVISGTRQGVEAALEILEDEYFVQGVVIDHNIPMHSSLFVGVAQKFGEHLARGAWRQARGFYLSNVTAVPIEDPSPAVLTELLTAHVHSPVLWRQSVEAVVARHPDAVFIEVGPRRVLYNLLQSKWVSNRKLKTDGESGAAPDFAAIAVALKDMAHAA